MRKISAIKAEISDCRARIKELQDEMDTINRMKKQNLDAESFIRHHISQRRVYLDRFRELNSRCTFSNKLAKKIYDNYSPISESRLDQYFQEIELSAEDAINQIKREIAGIEEDIYSKNIQIKILRQLEGA